MSQDGQPLNQLECRQALEGLRNGVPNGEAVRLLGCNQPEAEERFRNLIDRSDEDESVGKRPSGMLISGDFGSGKSHLLSYLEDVALEQGFVCSRVSISKETPLFDLGKVFKSAILHARMPDRAGNLMEEIGLKMNKRGLRSYDEFARWAMSPDNTILHPVFQASLMLHERLNDDEYNRDIESFWAGEHFAVSRVRQGLREINQQRSFQQLRAPRRPELPPQRLRFAVELIKGIGYVGWVVLLDEIELVGYYSAMQRARSYAELARWLGRVDSESYPGLIVVGSVTGGFEQEILGQFGKNDAAEAASRLQPRFGADLAAKCETGIRLLRRETTPLAAPTAEALARTASRLQEIYSAAYNWQAPAIEMTRTEGSYLDRMRYKIRMAINEWDLRRFYPNAQPDTEVTEYTPSFEEQTELEKTAEEDEPRGEN